MSEPLAGVGVAPGDHPASHAGAVTTLLDGAMAQAARARTDPAREVVTVDLHVAFLRPAAGPLRATGRVTGGGRSVCFCEADLVDADGTATATAIGTFRYRDALPPSPERTP